MEPTLTQNCALYYAQHKTSKRRATLFKKFRAAARKQVVKVFTDAQPLNDWLERNTA